MQGFFYPRTKLFHSISQREAQNRDAVHGRVSSYDDLSRLIFQRTQVLTDRRTIKRLILKPSKRWRTIFDKETFLMDP